MIKRIKDDIWLQGLIVVVVCAILVIVLAWKVSH